MYSHLCSRYLHSALANHACMHTYVQYRLFISMGPSFYLLLLWSMTHGPTQQTRNIEPMLFKCWPIVCDAGPTLAKVPEMS